MVIPPRVILPVVAPPAIMPPQVYVQSYPQTYYYPPPPPPPVYAQPAPPQVYVQPAPPPVYEQQPAPPVEYQPLPPPPVYVQPAPPQVYVQPAPPQVYVQPAPPPPFYVQPAPPPPVYAQPAPVPVLPPVVPVVATRLPQPQWKSRIGIGARFVGAISMENQAMRDRFSQLGFGGELLYRANRRVVLELGGEYQKRVTEGFERYDVPVTLGVRLHIGAPDWVVSPYFVGAVGGTYSKLDYLRSQDTAWFLDGQLGGGLELRLGQHFVLNADLRGDGRYRVTDPDSITQATQKVNGAVLTPMGNQYGLQGRLGAALYF